MPQVGFEPIISAGERPKTYLRLRLRGQWDRCCSGYYDQNNKMAGSVKFGELLEYLGARILKGLRFVELEVGMSCLL